MSLQLVKLQSISKAFGPRPLFEAVSLTISRGERIALIGENGSGKSTLAKIILKKEAYDSGELQVAQGIEIGYLPQGFADVAPDVSVRDYLNIAFGNLTELQERMRHLEVVMADSALEPETLQTAMDEWNDLYEKMEQKGGWTLENSFESVLTGLGLGAVSLDALVATLSGGQKARLSLAALLLFSPDLLILDEPTNHLDTQALEWLENFLTAYRGAVLLIAHDRMLINKVASSLVEISPLTRRLTVYSGNYETYLAAKEKEKEKLIRAYEERKEEIARLKMQIKAATFSKAKAKGIKDANVMAYDRHGESVIKSDKRKLDQAKARLAELEKEPLAHPFPKTVTGIVFHPRELISETPLSFQGLAKSFGKKKLFQDFDGFLRKGEKVVLMGSNGSGKTTFLNILAGLDMPDRGEIKRTPGVVLGYLDQELKQLDLQKTLFEELSLEFGLGETEVRSQLHKSGLLMEGALNQKIGSLSYGQQKKLCLLKLILSESNVLLLDEPTNHLDLKTLEELEKALLTFPGCVLAVSHDRWFVRKLANHIWRF